MVYRFGAPLYFANAPLFLDDVERLVSQASTPVRWFVLDAQAMVDVDTTGAGVLRQAITLLKKQNIIFAVSRADRSFRSWLERYHLMELIDPDRFYPTNRHAARHFASLPRARPRNLTQARFDHCLGPEFLPASRPQTWNSQRARHLFSTGLMFWSGSQVTARLVKVNCWPMATCCRSHDQWFHHFLGAFIMSFSAWLSSSPRRLRLSE